MTSYQFAWPQVYCDPARYARTMPTGFSSIPIATGRYPAGYRIANGQAGGGFPAAGATSNGTLPVRIQPPIRGTGRLTFVTNFKFLAHNRGSTTVEIAASLGVANVSGTDRPMFPYLGVSHDQDPWSDNLVHSTIAPGHIVQLSGFRLDIVDNDFAAVPGWPNWQMTPASGNQLWPAVCPCVRIRGGSLLIQGVFCHGYAC